MKPKNTELARAIGRRISDLRIARKLTQPELCERCGWGKDSQGRIANYERGERIPGESALADLACALSCTVGALLFGTTVNIHFVSVPWVEWNSIGKVKRSKTKTPLIQWPSVVPIGKHAQVTTAPNSYEAELTEGQLILVDTSLIPRPGDFVIVDIDGIKKLRLFHKANWDFEKSQILAVVISSVKTYR